VKLLFFFVMLQSWASVILWLVVSNMCYFPFHIWDVILPIDELRFFKMVIAPPTSFVVNSFGVTALLRCTGCTRRGMLVKASSPQISTSPLNCGMRQWGCEKWRVMLGE
jgi:hypothetical protein